MIAVNKGGNFIDSDLVLNIIMLPCLVTDFSIDCIYLPQTIL